MKNLVVGRWSFRPRLTISGREAYGVYPKGDRNEWSRKASLYPASDGQCFVISMHGQALDARPSFDAAVAEVVRRLGD